MEGVATFDTKDGGRAKIATITEGRDDGLFVRIESWYDNKRHPEAEAMEGKRVRITIKVLAGEEGGDATESKTPAPKNPTLNAEARRLAGHDNAEPQR